MPKFSRPLPSLNDHFQVKAVFDRSLLTYGCLFTPKIAENEERARSTLISGDIELAVRPSPLASTSVQGDQIRLRFDPGFYIAPNEAVELSSAVPTGYITVQGCYSVVSRILRTKVKFQLWVILTVSLRISCLEIPVVTSSDICPGSSTGAHLIQG